jgi:uncharacterized membrane protein YeaQ/YmgE (transglycosylase-associated protein family)
MPTPNDGQVKELNMGIVSTIIIGFIAGVIAKFIMPGSNEPKGFILTTILGIVGAVVAQYIPFVNGFGTIVGSIIGAIVVLAVWGIVSRGKTTA